MPEGHVTHRAARLHGKRFTGEEVQVSSPQGRFSASAEQISGLVITEIEAIGKHLFYWFGDEMCVHVHLGLFGRFRLATPPFPEPSANARLLIWTDYHELQLTGPNSCDLMPVAEVDRIKAGLGPDPIIDSAGGAQRFAYGLHRRRIPVGRAFPDQTVAAGIGNVFRSELLFLVGLNPLVPANEVSEETAERLWSVAVAELKKGERVGRIVTVEPVDVGVDNRSQLEDDELVYVYKRDGQPCRRCDVEITKTKIDSRNIWWCPGCQPGK